MTRATVSVGPPAENDTMMRTGLDGYLSSASAAAATSADAMTARAASNRSRLRISLSSLEFLPMLALTGALRSGANRRLRRDGTAGKCAGFFIRSGCSRPRAALHYRRRKDDRSHGP